MFGSKKTILYLTKNKVFVETINTRGKVAVDASREYSWSEADLSTVLTKIVSEFGSKCRLLLSDEFVYVINLVVPPKIEHERAFVKGKAQEVIPENLDETIWDYKEVLLVEEGKAVVKVVQVVALINHSYRKVFQLFKKSGLQIEAIEPVASALARLYQTEVEPVLLLYKADISLAVIVNNGLVVDTEIFKNDISEVKIADLIRFTKEHYNIQAAKLFHSDNIDEFKLSPTLAQNIKVFKAHIDPLVGLALKKDLDGKDEQVLNLNLRKLPEVAAESVVVTPPVASIATNIAPVNMQHESAAAEQDATTAVPSHMKSVLLLSLVLAVMLTLLGGLYYSQNYANQQVVAIKPSVVVTQAVTVSVAPSPTIKLEVYHIAVLNGSNLTGEATKLADILKEKDLPVDTVGNADSRDYTKTVIKFKARVKDSFKNDLDKILIDRYTDIEHTTLDEADTADIIIIIGNR